MPIFCSRVPFKTTLHWVITTLIPLGCNSASDFPVFNDLGSFEKSWSGILWNGPQLEFAWCFPDDYLEAMCLGEEDRRGKVPFSSCYITMTHPYWCCPCSLSWSGACQVSPQWSYSLPSSPLSVLYSLAEVAVHSPHLRDGELHSMNYLEFFYRRDLSVLSHLCIYSIIPLNQYGLMGEGQFSGLDYYK